MGLVDRIIIPIDKLPLTDTEKDLLKEEGIKFCNLYTFDLSSNNNSWYILNNCLYSITGDVIQINDEYPIICGFYAGQQSIFFSSIDLDIIDGLFEITSKGIIRSNYEY